MRYVKSGRMLVLEVPELTGESASTTLALLPVTTWPANMLVESPTPANTVYANFFVTDNGLLYPGLLKLPKTDSDTLTLLICKGAEYSASGFLGAGTKGTGAQSVSFATKDL